MEEDIFETQLNSVNVGDKFLVTSKDMRNPYVSTRQKYIQVVSIEEESKLGYTKAKYMITDPNFRFNLGCGEIPITILTGEDNSLGNGRFQYMVSKLN